MRDIFKQFDIELSDQQENKLKRILQNISGRK